MKICPSDIAWEAFVNSFSIAFVASTSNFGLAFRTTVSPDWFST